MERSALRQQIRHLVIRMRFIRNNDFETSFQSRRHGGPLQKSNQRLLPQNPVSVQSGPEQHHKGFAASQPQTQTQLR